MMKQTDLKNWDEFESKVAQLTSDRALRKRETGNYISEYLFRGQSNSSWHLETTPERYTGREAFCHPDMDKSNVSPRPLYSNEDQKTYYPALGVINASWLNSFSDNRTRDWKKKSYHFLSYSNVLDVISDGKCSAVEIPQSEYFDAERFIKSSIA